MSSVLCVDLDKTLLRVDSLHESIIHLFKINPFKVILSLFVILKGKNAFKEFIAKNITLNVDLLPENEDVLDYIASKRSSYKDIYLVTGAHESIAKEYSRKYEFFSDYHGTNKDINLIGKNKAKFLIEKYGSFDYIGDSKADLHIWKNSGKAIYAGADEVIWKSLCKINPNHEQIKIKKASLVKSIFKAIRMHQWAKNLLVFVPVILSHNYTDLILFKQSIIAFFGFSFTASSVYILNDLSDLDADRVHRRKKHRPIPSGDLSPIHALLVTFVFVLAAASLSTLLSLKFIGVLFVYFLITSLYSFRLKKIAILDVVLLAVLFTIRLLAGHFAINIEVSPWLLTFSIFIFSSLACLKRSTELREKLPAKGAVVGRGYSADDYTIINQIGINTGIIATLVMTLYLNSDAVVKLYSSPECLWLICPLLIFWIGRLWLLGNRGLVHEDPVVFVIKDKVSLFIGLICVVLVVIAR